VSPCHSFTTLYSSIFSIINVLYVRNVLNSDGKFFLLHMSNTWLNVIPLPKQAVTPAASLSRLNLNHSARFEVLTEMMPKTQVFWNMILSWGVLFVLRDHSTFIFRVKQFYLTMNEGIMIR